MKVQTILYPSFFHYLMNISNIFLSYRRLEAKHVACLICEPLLLHKHLEACLLDHFLSTALSYSLTDPFQSLRYNFLNFLIGIWISCVFVLNLHYTWLQLHDLFSVTAIFTEFHYDLLNTLTTLNILVWRDMILKFISVWLEGYF